jgi:hypothetical protein
MGKDITGGFEAEVNELKVSVVDIEECLPKPSRRRRTQQLASRLLRGFDFHEESPWPKLIRRALHLLLGALLLAIIAVMYDHPTYSTFLYYSDP